MEAGQYFAKLEYKHTFFEACIVRTFDPADGISWRWLVRDFYQNRTTNRQIKTKFRMTNLEQDLCLLTQSSVSNLPIHLIPHRKAQVFPTVR